MWNGYEHLKPPGLREIYAVLSSTAIPYPAHRREQFQRLADGFPDGWHEVGWYLHWLAVERFDLSVLIQYNRILSDRHVGMFRSIPKNTSTVSAERMLENPVYRDRVDAPKVLRYVLHLREDVVRAGEFLEQNLIPVLSTYLGKPGLRACIDPEAEERLWIRAVSLCASCTRP